jgi:ribosomal-protein-alanine N-acetyltransferase
MGPSLYTDRLQLREWKMDDADAALQIYGDPEVMHFLGDGKPVVDLAAQQQWLAERIERYRGPEFKGLGPWAIVQRDTKEVIGTMLLKQLPPTSDQIEIGWHLARRVWGCGFASEAARVVLQYGFIDLSLERIFAVIKPGNLRSAAVARRIGMQWIERTNRYYGGEELDLFVADRE